MKNIILSIAAIFIFTNCSMDEPVSNPATNQQDTTTETTPPDNNPIDNDPQDPVDYSLFTNEVYSENTNCVSRDFIKIDAGAAIMEFNYGDPGCPGICYFGEGNYSGEFTDGAEGHAAHLPLKNNWRSTFTDFPFQEGGTITLPEGDKIIDNLWAEGLDILLIIPERLTANLVPGDYKFVDNHQEDLGIQVYLSWGLEYDNTGRGFSLVLDKTQPHFYEFTCVDRSNPDFVRLTGSLNGTFQGRSFDGSNDIIYERTISIDFAYQITF